LPEYRLCEARLRNAEGDEPLTIIMMAADVLLMRNASEQQQYLGYPAPDFLTVKSKLTAIPFRHGAGKIAFSNNGPRGLRHRPAVSEPCDNGEHGSTGEALSEA